eukprot:gene7200-9827_t
MVKERPPQGIRNLTPGREDTNNISPNVESDSKFTRSWTHKLISPDEYKPPVSIDKHRKIEVSATWLPKKLIEPVFLSESKAKFTVPDQSKADHGFILKSIEQAELERQQHETQQHALEKLCKLAKIRYGTTASMLKSFKKKPGDTVSVYEIREYMKRHKSDVALPEEDIKHIFDMIDEKNEGSVPVIDLLQRAEQQEFIDYEHRSDMAKIKNFLQDHLEEIRKQKLEKSSKKELQLESLKKTKSVLMEDKLFQQATGQKAFGLSMSAEEFDEAVNDAFSRNQTKVELNKFARFLRHSNVRMKALPFYDMRAERLDRLKHRAVMIDEKLEGPELGGRLKELSESRWRGSLAALDEQGATLLLNSTNNYNDDNYDNNKNQYDSPMKQMNFPDKSNRSLPVTTRNLVNEASKGMELDSSLLSLSSGRFQQKLYQQSPSPDRNYDNNSDYYLNSNNSEAYLLDKNESQPSDFYTCIIDSSQSMGRMKDYSKVLRVEKTDPLKDASQGKKILAENVTDWTRVGVGGDQINNNNDPNDRFLTTNGKFYPPLIYEPSQPVRRDIISEADIEFRKREYRRQQRRERMEANTNVTKVRLEYDVLEKEAQGLRRAAKRLDDNIRYNTVVFLNDLQMSKSIPLERMARKPNYNASDKMWGGNIKTGDDVVEKETRDFVSTYRASFNSEILKTIPRIE